MANDDVHTVAGKKKFIRDLCKSIAEGLVAQVDKMPEEWDGIELRQAIADTAQSSTAQGWGRADAGLKRRMREYKNSLITRGIRT
jgi:hypothetical protein